jgi:hypothetical protein
MDTKLQGLLDNLISQGFGKGIDIEAACKKLKKADLVQVIKDQQKTLVHLNTRLDDSVRFVKLLDMGAFNKAKTAFASKVV